MTASSDEIGIHARKNLTAILQAFGKLKQTTIAAQLGVSDAKVSRMKDQYLADIAKLLAVCGLEVIPRGMAFMDQKQVDALVHLATQFQRGDVDER